MTLAEAAVKAGYEPEDEKYVRTVGYFTILKGIRAMKYHLENQPAHRDRCKRLLQEALDEL